MADSPHPKNVDMPNPKIEKEKKNINDSRLILCDRFLGILIYYPYHNPIIHLFGKLLGEVNAILNSLGYLLSLSIPWA